MTSGAPDRRDVDPPRQRVPWQQMLLDDIFLLFLCGMVIPTFFYIIWGLMSLGEVPIFAR